MNLKTILAFSLFFLNIGCEYIAEFPPGISYKDIAEENDEQEIMKAMELNNIKEYSVVIDRGWRTPYKVHLVREYKKCKKCKKCKICER